MSDRLKCPLQQHPDGMSDCVEAECAWWQKYGRTCAILSLANSVSLAQKFGLASKKPGYKAQEGGSQGEF